MALISFSSFRHKDCRTSFVLYGIDCCWNIRRYPTKSIMDHSLALLLIFLVLHCCQRSLSFQVFPLVSRSTTANSRRQLVFLPATVSSNTDGDIIDADFERVVDVYSTKTRQKRQTSTKKKPSNSVLDDEAKDSDENPKNLLDLSLDADPRWKVTRIPFCRGDEYIDGKLAFMVELDGTQYGIAVPFDDAVAVIIQDNAHDEGDTKANKNPIEYVNPDLYEENEEYQELMEIMAAQVQKEFGDDITLRKTPRVLTISGDITSVTNNWKNNVFGTPISIDDMLSSTMESGDEEDELSDFLDFMRKELGNEEYEKTIKEEMSEEDKLLMKFFDVPELSNDPEILRDLIQSMDEDLKDDAGVQARAREFEIEQDDKALKLFSFEFGESGKSYSLVKLLRPYILVGRLDADVLAEGDKEKKSIQFELLSPEEESALIPQLEVVCKDKLAAAGLDWNIVSA